MASIVECKGKQLTIDLDRSEFSICPNCSLHIVAIADGCDVCGWNDGEKLLGGNENPPLREDKKSSSPVSYTHLTLPTTPYV